MVVLAPTRPEEALLGRDVGRRRGRRRRGRSTPFTYEDSSLARKSAALTISRGFASRPIGQWIRRRSSAAGSSPKICSRSGVSTGPGQRALTRTPCARELDAELAAHREHGALRRRVGDLRGGRAEDRHEDATLITEPPPRSSRYGIPCLQQRKTPCVLTACTRSHASTECRGPRRRRRARCPRCCRGRRCRRTGPRSRPSSPRRSPPRRR